MLTVIHNEHRARKARVTIVHQNDRKMDAIDEDDGPDPLDVVGPTSSQPRPTVRFENGPNDLMQTPTRPSGIFLHPHSISVLTPVVEVASETRPSPSRLDQILNPSPLPPPSFLQIPNIVEQQLSPVGRDAEDSQRASTSNIVDINHPPPIERILPDVELNPTSIDDMPIPPLLLTLPAQGESIDVPETTPLDPQELMEVDERRSPSPPPPIFVVNDDNVTTLETSFVEHTSHLTVEQLEQLRATCLGCIWRHRQEWNRDALVREMMDVIAEFSEEASSYERDMDDE